MRGQIADVTIEQLSLGASLGEGASGDVFAAHMVSLFPLTLLRTPCLSHICEGPCSCTVCYEQEGEEVAVKVFKGEVSPDGKAADEIAVTCYVNHPHLTR